MSITSPSRDVALKFLSDTLKEVAPTGYTADYSGLSRQFVLGNGSFAVTMLFALIIVYLALAAQFESFRDPTVILVSVPMALFGALLLSTWALPRSTSTPRSGS